MIAEVHQEIHREFERINSHVKLQYAVDPPAVGLVALDRRRTRIDRANADLAQNPHARTRTAIYRALHQWYEDELRQEQRKCCRRHPSVEVNNIGEDRKQYPALEEGL